MKTSRPSLNTHNSELRACTQPLVGDISDYTNPDVQVNDDVFLRYLHRWRTWPYKCILLCFKVWGWLYLSTILIIICCWQVSLWHTITLYICYGYRYS